MGAARSAGQDHDPGSSSFPGGPRSHQTRLRRRRAGRELLPTPHLHTRGAGRICHGDRHLFRTGGRLPTTCAQSLSATPHDGLRESHATEGRDFPIRSLLSVRPRTAGTSSGTSARRTVPNLRLTGSGPCQSVRAGGGQHKLPSGSNGRSLLRTGAKAASRTISGRASAGAL
jgi:hypothetical protein